MKPKAIVLFSGGLDSILAAKIVALQGVDVEAVYFHSVFSHLLREEGEAMLAERTRVPGIPFTVVDISEEQIALVKGPPSGFGANMNPCLDCKALMFRKAKAFMEEKGALFLVSGEVVGQRPMSQRMEAFRRLELHTGLQGRILRPLSAKLLDPTVAEQQGVIDRERLYDFQGRSRKGQVRLAAELGIGDYPQPGGGCLLTDPGYSRRLRDLREHTPGFGRDDVGLLRYGRHFRISPQAKLIVPRQAEEAEKLAALYNEDLIRFVPESFDGYESFGTGTFDEGALLKALAIAGWYLPAGVEKSIRVIRRGEEKVFSAGEDDLVLHRACLI